MSDKTVREVRDEMAALRNEVSTDVSGVLGSARELADWRYYVRRFPWQCLSVATLAGFWLVPRRAEVITPDPDALLDLAAEDRVVIAEKPELQATGTHGLGRRLVKATARFGLILLGHEIGEMLASVKAPDQQQVPDARPARAGTGTRASEPARFG